MEARSGLYIKAGDQIIYNIVRKNRKVISDQESLHLDQPLLYVYFIGTGE